MKSTPDTVFQWKRATDASTSLTTHKRYEYLVADLDREAPMDHLNAFGQLGWSLVSVVAANGEQRAYFKRITSEKSR